MIVTWINLSVTGHTISIHNVLEAGSECVGVKECWRRCGCRKTVVEGVHTATTLSLRNRKDKKLSIAEFTAPNPAVNEKISNFLHYYPSPSILLQYLKINTLLFCDIFCVKQFIK